jgi:very-short-patch-repair endonuclease
MKLLPYKHSNITLARNLRKNMTPWERKLWYEFLREYPVRFQRQKPIGNYIVDFYCFKAKLIVELDGSQHYDKNDAIKDIIRTERLEEFNLTVLRIPNYEIDENFVGVCEYIDDFVRKNADFDF